MVYPYLNSITTRTVIILKLTSQLANSNVSFDNK